MENRMVTAAEYFWERVQVTPGCWLWKGYVSTTGYGHLSWCGKMASAHRIAYRLAKGDFDAKLLVLHTCDTPLCCNPDHLFLGTHLDNARDRNRKGRTWVPRLRGEKVGCSKLKANDVLEMRRRYQAGESGRSLAKAFGVSHSTAWRVLKGKLWTHVV